MSARPDRLAAMIPEPHEYLSFLMGADALFSSLNKDPIEKTSDMLQYLAGNPFDRGAIEAFHGHSHG
jgi:hypothetical protein